MRREGCVHLVKVEAVLLDGIELERIRLHKDLSDPERQ